MPLETLHTRLTRVTTEAQTVRRLCLDSIAAMLAGPVSANALVTLIARFQGARLNVIAPALLDAALPAYAAEQFGDPSFNLSGRMQAVDAGLAAAVAAAQACVPVDADGYLLKDRWAADGSVDVRTVSAAATASLRGVLQAVADGIGE